jgi:ABC-type multidrug transport system ATPase subunit
VRVRADQVSVDGPHGTLLPPTSLSIGEGRLAIVHGEPGVGITAFGLALAGRLKPTTGTVTVDGEPDEARLRDQVAVVDAPGVNDPDGALPLHVVVGEELELAGRPAGKEDVTRWLTEHNLAGRANTRFEHLDGETRTRLLADLAALRRGVRMLVLDTPDRHTSELDSWQMLGHEHAERGLAVVVLIATTPLVSLREQPARIGAQEQPEPQLCQEEPTEQTDHIEHADTGEAV